MASKIQIKRGTGSAVPSGLLDGELAINLDNNKLYFGSGSTSVNKLALTELTADKAVITQLTSSIVSSSIIYSSGSNIFGDAAGDTHTFNGHITASGNISSSKTGKISAGSGSYHILQGDKTKSTALYVDGHITSSGTVKAEHFYSTDDVQIDDDLTVSGDINANGNIVGDDSTDIKNIEIINMWGLVHSKGDYTQPHDHELKSISSGYSWVYYVNVDDECSNLVFTMSNEVVKPNNGLLVVFPLHLVHHVPIQEVNYNRVSISGNSKIIK